MWDTIAIIVLLGGLEYILWSITARHDKYMEVEDRETQAKQIEILDGILTELSILNSTDVTQPQQEEAHELQDDSRQEGMADA